MPPSKKSKKVVSLDGESYIWDGNRWYNKSNLSEPAGVIVRKLNRKLEELLADEDSNITNEKELVKKASKARKIGHYKRALKLSEKALALNSDNVAAAAVLCSTLRAMNEPEMALQKTKHLANCNSSFFAWFSGCCLL